MVKAKTINPTLIADISVFFCIVPILAFLIFFNQKIERLKWVCLLLLVSNLTFDLYSIEIAKTPVAEGMISESSLTKGKHILVLEVIEGDIYEGQYIRSENFTGTVIHLLEHNSAIDKHTLIEVEGNNKFIKTPVPFQVFSNLWIINIAILFELGLIFIFFYTLFQNISLWKRLSGFALLFVIVWWVYRNLIEGKLHTNGGVFNGVLTLFIIIFALTYFYQQLNNTKNLFIYSTPAFWLVSGILIYKTSTFFLFIYSNVLHQSQKANFYLINSISYILLGIFFTIAFSIKDKKVDNKLHKRLR